jgi:hypothetical protein
MRRLLSAVAFLFLTTAAFSQDGTRPTEPPKLVAPVYCATVRLECPSTGHSSPPMMIGGVPSCSLLDDEAYRQISIVYEGEFSCPDEEPVMVYEVDCHVCQPGEWPPVPIPDPNPPEARVAQATEPCKVSGMTCYFTFANGKKRGFSAYGPCARQIIQRKACDFAKADCTTICSCDRCRCTQVNPNSNCLTQCGRCR